MPVTLLLVEGKLDAEILSKVFAGVTTIQSGKCSKNALAPRVRTERAGSKPHTYYLRDRDYDSEPPQESLVPEVDLYEDPPAKTIILGWRWCRHSLECYLLEPSIVSAATSIETNQYLEALAEAAGKIRYYQVARWAVGSARKALPPSHKFQTHPPDSGKEFSLPDDLGEQSCWDWSRNHASAFLANVSDALSESSLERTFQKCVETFDADFLKSPDQILHWFSGKDLMTALADWLRGNGIGGPNNFRTRLADWMDKNPDKALELLPEWNRFKEIIKNYP